MSKVKVSLLAVSLLVLAGTQPVSAVPTVGITTPADGASIVRVPGAKLLASGPVSFVVPQQTSQTLYLHNQCSEPPRDLYTRSLTTELPTQGQDLCTAGHALDLWPSAGARGYQGAPAVTVDASRPATGQVTVAQAPTSTGPIGAGDLAIDIELRLPAGTVNVPTITTILLPTDQPKVFEWSVPLPAEADKADGSVWMQVTLSGAAEASAVIVHRGASFFTIPTYSGSLKRKVELSIDEGEFSSTGVKLAEDGQSWSATLSMPLRGDHTISARSVQGPGVSEPVTHSFEIT